MSVSGLYPQRNVGEILADDRNSAEKVRNGTFQDGQNFEPSEVNIRLGRLKSSALQAIQSRARVPQPLFWSLLHAELKEIKKLKSTAQAERDAWLSGHGTEPGQEAGSE